MKQQDTRRIGWHAHGSDGVVAAGAWPSVVAGLAVLERGGNAVDAAIATILALAITDYGLFAIGGECPMLVADAQTGDVRALSGLGVAPGSRKAIEWYEQHGIPADGDIRAALVPAIPDLAVTALKQYGTLSFAAVAEPAIALLEQDRAHWHMPLARTMKYLCEAEQVLPGSREDKLQAVSDRFYRGDIGERLAAYYGRCGSFLSKSDLASHKTRIEQPVSVTTRGHTIFKCGPWTQGPVLCQTLQILDSIDLRTLGHLTPDYVHTLAEALKLAFADRDHYYADPLFADVPLAALLDPEYARLRRGLIHPERASEQVFPGDPHSMAPILKAKESAPWIGGTTTCVVCDRWGNMVAATPSANQPYAVCEELGIAHGNRLRCLNTTPNHPNRLESGKRPRITLTPTIVCKDGQPCMAISVAGGDLQDQTTLNCLLNVLEFGMSPQEAVTAPRFSTEHHQNSFRPDAERPQTMVARQQLTLDTGITDQVARELTSRGHRVMRTDKPIACPVMIVRNSSAEGRCQAAGDPKAGRHAGALNIIR